MSGLIRAVLTTMRELAQVSSIHGLHHFTHRRRHAIEHLVWIALLIGAVVGAMAISTAAWHRYQLTPSVISMERDYQEWNTSVPAGTLCPYDRVNIRALDRLVKQLAKGWGEKDGRVLRNFIMDISNATYTNFHLLEKYLKAPEDLLPTPDQYLDIINMVKLDLEFDVSSSLESSPVLTVQTVTELGICWAFNAPLAQYNANSYWKSGKMQILGNENQILQSSPLSGEVYLQVTNLNSGYQFFVHAGTEIADVSDRIYTSTQFMYTTLEVTALAISSSPETRDLSPAQRQCHLPEDRPLELSPVYTFSFCRVQCRMKLAHTLCGCVPHFYRPLSEYKICDVAGLLCLAKYSKTLVKLRNETNDEKITCPCLPSCDHVTYIPERVTAIPWDLGTNIKWGLNRYPRLRLRRNILFGFTDLLVSIGGTVGLFLGCSLLGGLELIYFFSVRIIVTCVMGKKQNNKK